MKKWATLVTLSVLASACANVSDAPATTSVGVESSTPGTSSPEPTSPGDLTAPTTRLTTPGIIGVDGPPPTTPGLIESIAVIIPDCSPYLGNLTTLECVTTGSFSTCNTQLVAGKLEDCRANLPVPFLEVEAIGNQLETSSNLEIEVFSADPGVGNVTGRAEYHMALPTPIRPPAEHCNTACPTEACGEDHCNRNCIRADGRSERTTGASGGLFAISALSSPSCPTQIGGTVTPDHIDFHRAFEACDRRDSWGESTQIALTLKTGKLYHFNNPTAEMTTNGNTVTWQYTNDVEIYYLYRNVDLIADVSCRISRAQ